MLSLALCGLLCGACGRFGIDLLPPFEDALTGLDAGVSPSDAGPSSSVDAGPDGLADASPELPADAGQGTTGDAAPSCNLDSDGDGTVDCEDACASDPEKVVPGVCGCSVDDVDSDRDGVLDCMDSCGGTLDTSYVPNASCGVGYCQTTNVPSSCVAGSETLCQPGTPRSASDATCDGIDDDCSGSADEDYAPVQACGVGSCSTRSTPSSCASGIVTACQPAAPLASNDATMDGIDDDCDGVVDEDVCVPRTETFGVGMHSASPGTCKTITVKLWGGGGASGDAQSGYWGSTTGGTGGAGGYVRGVFTVSATSSVQLLVGQGGQGCGGPGTNVAAAYNGGSGATTRAQPGSAGNNGSVAGGAGASPSAGGRGGAGFFGGGGGGAGAGPTYAPFGMGGGGGAATVLVVDGARMIGGGGGGGAGAGTDVATAGYSGGNGGAGCSGAGVAPTAQGGGGGGGGVCLGGASSQRAGRLPYDAANELPAATATGGSSTADCDRGGGGYAIVSYTP